MLNPDLHLIIAQAITFLVGLFLLWKIAYKPLLAIMKQRSDKIAQDLDAAEKARRDMEQAKAHFTQELAKLDEKARDLVKQATREGQEARNAILGEARAQSQDILKRAEERLALEKQQALMELRREAMELSLLMTEKVLGQAVDSEVQHKLVDEVFAQLEEKR